MIALIGLVLLHLIGAVLLALVTQTRTRDAVRSPTSTFFALAAFFLAVLCTTKLGLVAALISALLIFVLHRQGPDEASAVLPWRALSLAAGVMLARPLVPRAWDEFVWLAKARLEAHGFGASVHAALDPAQHLIPSGYPPLWPAAVSWLGLGVDTLTTQVLAAALLTLLCLAVCFEAWRGFTRAGSWLLLVAASTPFFWVHLRTAYVDLPLGLLGAAVLGFLLSGRLAHACVIALVMSAFKDEGFLHVVTATGAVLAVRGLRRQNAALLWPLVFSVSIAALWRLLLRQHEIIVVDHAIEAPMLSWLPTIASLTLRHATDVPTWGVFWAVVVVTCLQRVADDASRSLRWALGLGAISLGLAVLLGSERVHAFAENGTLINRLLLQLWPLGALQLLLEFKRPTPEDSQVSRGQR